MLQDLERLVELQVLDSEIAVLEAAAAAIPGEIQTMEQQWREAQATLDAATVEVERAQKLRRQKERELEEASSESRKRQGRLYEIKTNVEYAAVLKEIEGLKQKISTLEEEILLLLDEIDSAVKIRDQEAAKVKVTQAEFQRNKAQREGELQELQGRLSALHGTREGRSRGVEASLLQQYVRLLKSRDGLAVAQAKGRSCEGCHLTLTPQLYNEVRRNEEIHTCERCGRILYWKG